MTTPDTTTRQWIRNRSDELAAAGGARFDEERAQHIVDFCERELVLYEGECAGQPMLLGDWQLEVLRRVFGWVVWSDDWQREVRRFRKASVWVPKKNGKSPTAAAVGLYLLARDGESGQKVYSAARDGKQAAIVHMHAQQMVLRSPTLSHECTINKATGRIVHNPTTSWYQILAGDNIDSQEGLNGSVVIDETHVVDKRLADVLKYMGASRSEPLQFEVSTAGKNPEGYGKQQYDYGRSVADGKFRNDQFFWHSYEAPPGLSDEQLDDEGVWKAANPTWGRIIKPGEFRAAFAEAKRSVVEFSNFKMYRLNIWQQSSSPWLRKEDWDACADDFTLERFVGCDCWLGIDLSKTKDMTSAVLMFKGDEPDEVYQWPMFWMPEEEARRRSHLASYLEWAAGGYLALTSGNTVDFARVREDICDVVAAHDLRVQMVGYDPLYAEEMTQLMEEEFGCKRVQIKQSALSLTEPINDYERCVIAHKMRHPDHPILNWQAGHVQLTERPNRTRILHKPEADNHKKIDGIAAGVNVITHVLQAPVYDDSPVFG